MLYHVLHFSLSLEDKSEGYIKTATSCGQSIDLQSR